MLISAVKFGILTGALWGLTPFWRQPPLDKEVHFLPLVVLASYFRPGGCHLDILLAVPKDFTRFIKIHHR